MISPKSSQSRLEKHFATCTALTGVAVALGGPQAAKGAITVITPAVPINVPNTVDGIYVVLDTGVTGPLGSSTPGWDINPFLGGGNLDWFTTTAVGSANSIASSTDGTVAGLVQSVLPGTDLSTLIYDPAAYNLNSSAAILGGGTFFIAVTFEDGTAAVNRAWIEITTTGGGVQPGFPATINRWAFAPIGESLAAGQTVAIPETGSAALGLLAAGAMGLRRRRAA